MPLESFPLRLCLFLAAVAAGSVVAPVGSVDPAAVDFVADFRSADPGSVAADLDSAVGFDPDFVAGSDLAVDSVVAPAVLFLSF